MYVLLKIRRWHACFFLSLQLSILHESLVLVPRELRRDPLQPSAVHIHQLRLRDDGGVREEDEHKDAKKHTHNEIRNKREREGAGGVGGATRGGRLVLSEAKWWQPGQSRATQSAIERGSPLCCSSELKPKTVTHLGVNGGARCHRHGRPGLIPRVHDNLVETNERTFRVVARVIGYFVISSCQKVEVGRGGGT